MLSLGLDPSLRSFGWAVYDSDAPPHRRLVDSGHEATFVTTVPVARFIHFRAMVQDLIERYSVAAVGIESPAYGGGPFSETHFGLMLFSLESIFSYRLDCILFDPGTLKFLAKIDPDKKKGKMSKLDIQRFVSNDRNNPKLINNDEADAYVVAKFATRMIDLADGNLDPKKLSPSEFQVFLGRTRTVKGRTGVKRIKKTAHIFRENSRFFRFSRVPRGNVDLPNKQDIDPTLLKFLQKKNRLKMRSK